MSRPFGNANVIPSAYLLSPLRARLWNRNVGIEAAAAICQQVTAGKEPVKAVK